MNPFRLSLLPYRRLRLFAVLLLVVEFVVGMGGWLTPRHEVFPFASWFLFTLVPNRTTEYDLEFRAANDRPLTSPVRFSRAPWLVPQPHSITAFNVIQALGASLEHGTPPETRALRAQIDNLCGPAHLTYDLVKVTYDPVARYDTGAALHRRVLGTFTTHQP